jgi:hypothetical protein
LPINTRVLDSKRGGEMRGKSKEKDSGEGK